MAVQSMIEFDNVSIVFGTDPAPALRLMDQNKNRAEVQVATGQVLGVHNCSLTINEGEISVLMGLSGSGKSTLLRAINGLNQVVRGAVRVRSRQGEMIDVVTCSEGALRALRRGSVSMVFQQFGLLPWRTVIENVALGLELAGVGHAERLDRARKVLDTVNLTDWAEKKVSELSGGMQQRVGLARAFATDAPILLMDEPFSALDPLIRNRLQDELLVLQERMRCTIVFVSHDLEEAVKLGSNITIMEGGRIVQSGQPKDIVLNPADAYVADFVAELNPLSVLSVEDAMVADTGPGDPARMVKPGAMLRTVLPLFRQSSDPVWIGEGDAVRGRVEAGTVCGLLARTAA